MIAFFAKHPTAANLLMAIIIILGLTALPDIKRETFPDFQAKTVQITIVYPGATPAEASSALCLPIEDAIDGLDQLDELTCEARENIAIATVDMQEGGNIDKLVAEVKNEIDAIDSFPDGIELPIVEEKGRTDEVIHLAIQSDINEVELKEYAETIKDKLKRIDGVANIEVGGFSDHQLRVNLSLSKLREYGLTTQDVAESLANQNLKMPGGNLEGNDKTVLLRFDQQRVTANLLEELVIFGGADGGQIKLKELGFVEDRFEDEEVHIRFNGKRAALLKISKSKAEDAIDIATDVMQFVDKEKAMLPSGISMTLTNNTSTIIQDRLSMLLTNGAQGILLVFAVMWLFFSYRYAFWVSMGLPVSFLGTLFLISILGISINMISMVAMLMAIGILMDDAIVIAESIATQVAKNGDVDKGAIDGVKLVLPGVVSSFLTTCAIFGGMAFISGDIGQVLKVIPMVLLLTLSVSLIEAFLILPNHLVHSLHKHKETNETGFKLKFTQKFETFRDVYLVNVVEKVVTYRYAFLGGLFVAFLLSLSLFVGGLLKFKAFPNTEGDILEARLILASGTPFDKTQIVVKQITEAANTLNREFSKQEPDNQSLIKNITVEYNQNRDAFSQGAHLATVRMELQTVEDRITSIYDVHKRWQELVGSMPSIVSLSITEPSIGPAGRAIEIRLSGVNVDQLMQHALAIKSELNQYQGVNNLLLDTREGKEELIISMKPGALSFQVNGSIIANQLRGAYNGIKVDDIQRGSEQIELDVRLQDADKLNINQLNNFPIILPDGTEIPLSAVAKIQQERGVSRINRIEGQPTVTIIGDVDPLLANTAEVLADIDQNFIQPLLQQQPNLQVKFEGEAEEGNKTSASIGQKFLLGLVGIFIILSYQFKSYFEPVMVMTAIPLALIGVLWGHFLLGFDMTMPSIVGFISLAGIVVNDSILLVVFIKQHMQEGMDAHKAAVMAAKERFRAVFITSATTIAGTFPLLLETSTQAQVLQPLVVSLIFGIIASTCLILFLLPALYVILQDFGLASNAHMQEPDTFD